MHRPIVQTGTGSGQSSGARQRAGLFCVCLWASLSAPALSDKSLLQCGRAPGAAPVTTWSLLALAWKRAFSTGRQKPRCRYCRYDSNRLIRHKARDEVAGAGTPTSALLRARLPLRGARQTGSSSRGRGSEGRFPEASDPQGSLSLDPRPHVLAKH